jgi:hypothetical protein
MAQVYYKNRQPFTEEVNNENSDCVDQVAEIHLFVVLNYVPYSTQQKAYAKHTEIDNKFDLRVAIAVSKSGVYHSHKNQC